MPKLIDLTNKIMGDFKVIKKEPSIQESCGTMRVVWSIECLGCGYKRTKTSKGLRRDKNICKKCRKNKTLKI